MGTAKETSGQERDKIPGYENNGCCGGAQLMGKDPSKIKVCPECRRLVEAATMRPLSRNQLGSGIRYVCPDCFKRVLALRKVVREARGK
jgi:hypothetical protein